MKALFLFAALLVSTGAQAAAPKFSAFADGDNLYVTVLADSCNALHPALIVPDLCHADRLTKNAAISCEVELTIAQSLMACPGPLVPKVLTLSLKAQKVAGEAKTLIINSEDRSVEVQLKD